MTLTVGALNAHNRRGAVRHMLALELDTLGLGEVHRRLPLLLRAGGRYRIAGDVEVRAATPILTRRDLEHRGHLTMRASDPAAPEKIAPARWVTASLFTHPTLGAVAHVNVHPNAVTDGRPLAVPRVRETARYWRTVHHLLEALGRDYAVVLTGDVNSRRSGETPGYAGARDVLEAHGLEVARWDGLDLIAHDPRRLELARVRTLGREVTGSDHPALIATYRKAHP